MFAIPRGEDKAPMIETLRDFYDRELEHRQWLQDQMASGAGPNWQPILDAVERLMIHLRVPLHQDWPP
jgi:hypothetical protein